MPYTLTQLAADIRETLARGADRSAKEAVCTYVSRALKDEVFLATHLKDRAPGADPREVLYEDPDLGFCICGHVYRGQANGAPHDHGPSWAIYGQAAGVTEMTDWRIAEAGVGRGAHAGRAGPDLPDAPRRRPSLRRGQRPLPQARGPREADPHRGPEPRPRKALSHQGGVGRPRAVTILATHRRALVWRQEAPRWAAADAHISRLRE